MLLTGIERHVMDKRLTGINLLLLALVLLNPGFTGASGGARDMVLNSGSYEYGLPFDASQSLKAVVKPGQTLSKILSSHKVSYGRIHAVALKSRTIFDVRKLKAGNPYLIVKGSGSGNQPKYFIYEHDPIDFVVFKLEDPVNVYRGRKKVGVKWRTTSGVIEKSLASSLQKHPYAHELAVRLSEIYAWSIDFYHLQKGDHFKVLFEDKCVEERSLGLGNILAAKFNHRGSDFYAFYFEQGHIGRYYDEKGVSIEKAFLKSPLKYGRITSRYSKGRLHPILKRYRPHYGIDYAAPKNTPIMTVGKGIILEAGYDKDRGKYITIRHNSIYSTQYFHMSRFARGIRPGVPVKQGDIIGNVGSTGLATGPHLEFRLMRNGHPVDPLKEDMPVAEPLKKEYQDTFQRQTAVLKKSLDRIEMDVASKTL
jgi:murein DD-endopeptidase MepM/ murein hydrolase activator NlpD